MSDLARPRRISRSFAKTYTESPIVSMMNEAVANAPQMTSDEWCTGSEITVPLLQFFGGPVGVDPCSNDRSIVKAHKHYTEGGLVLPWHRPRREGKDTAYSNWPYSSNEDWSAKAIKEIPGLSELVVLCMTATSTRWWRSLMTKPKRNPRVIATKRLRFIGPSGKPMDSSRFEPSLIYYGKRTKAFDKEFRHVAMWSTWGR